jgi:hypothetical protein
VRIFDKLNLCLIAYVLIKGSVKSGHARSRLIYHFLAVKRDGTRYLALAILVRDAFCEPFLRSKVSGGKKKKRSPGADLCEDGYRRVGVAESDADDGRESRELGGRLGAAIGDAGSRAHVGRTSKTNFARCRISGARDLDDDLT